MICGLQAQNLRKHMDKIGLTSHGNPGVRGPRGRSRSEEASRLVDAGMTIGEAAMTVGLSNVSVRRYRIQHGLPTRRADIDRLSDLSDTPRTRG
jgi:hypothetical protein